MDQLRLVGQDGILDQQKLTHQLKLIDLKCFHFSNLTGLFVTSITVVRIGFLII